MGLRMTALGFLKPQKGHRCLARQVAGKEFSPGETRISQHGTLGRPNLPHIGTLGTLRPSIGHTLGMVLRRDPCWCTTSGIFPCCAVTNREERGLYHHQNRWGLFIPVTETHVLGAWFSGHMFLRIGHDDPSHPVMTHGTNRSMGSPLTAAISSCQAS